MPEVVYRSTHPDVLAHWDRAGSADAQTAWRARVDQVIADLGFPGRRFATSDGLRGVKVTGVEHPKDEPVPAGWRRDGSLPGAITPDRRRRLGKEVAERLDGLAAPNPRRDLPGGMPDVAFSSLRLMRPGVARLGDAVVVTWSAEIDSGDAEHIDPAVWERIRLSEYYAAVEAEQDGGQP
ncbi:hypothetical protein [Thermomonospora umbrina]|uniref:Uncharacterized protein n=1 Tax=Thermomonospora umbrina TaxID=111806 RepID=A0A3D9SWB4_9ACTN|nr:hypothetical protein [Thermomonospora umbrina]REF00240.1 hypothetical protein DFJ69_5768 [Thermomonospora umbrina]